MEITKREREIRIDEQQKLGKALQGFLNDEQVRFSPFGLMALDEIVADMAEGKYDTSRPLSKAQGNDEAKEVS